MEQKRCPSTHDKIFIYMYRAVYAGDARNNWLRCKVGLNRQYRVHFVPSRQLQSYCTHNASRAIAAFGFSTRQLHSTFSYILSLLNFGRIAQK